MPAVSKPKVPRAGFGAGACGGAVSAGATGAATSGGGDAVHPARAVVAARRIIIRVITISPIPVSWRDSIRARVTLPPFAPDPPAPYDERHDIAYQRNAKPDQEQAGYHRRRGVRQQPLEPHADMFAPER